MHFVLKEIQVVEYDFSLLLYKLSNLLIMICVFYEGKKTVVTGMRVRGIEVGKKVISKAGARPDPFMQLAIRQGGSRALSFPCYLIGVKKLSRKKNMVVLFISMVFVADIVCFF